MGLFKKKDSDPISERSKQLSEEIAELEARIKKLNQQIVPEDGPRLRSTVNPNAQPKTPPAPKPPAEPVFEDIDHNPLKAPPEPLTTAQHYNELGARKYDLPALIRRIKKHFHGPAASNPKLINYLAAGSIQGLRPLRYERRVARNRFIALTIILILVLLGIFSFLFQPRH